jgi:hypothetical protein
MTHLAVVYLGLIIKKIFGATIHALRDSWDIPTPLYEKGGA